MCRQAGKFSTVAAADRCKLPLQQLTRTASWRPAALHKESFLKAILTRL
jgi:hypothetical protein